MLLYSMVIFVLNMANAQAPELMGSLQAQNTLLEYCQKRGGKIIDQWTCPHSKVIREGPFCVLDSSPKSPLVFNGCTGVSDSYGEHFFPACVIHDFCYHNEPGVSRKNKETCDLDFYNNMLEICRRRGDSSYCRVSAKLFYQGAARFGSKSWVCSKEITPYPNNIDDI